MSKYKGEIADFPEEVVEMMLDYQESHRGKRDVSVFENNRFNYFKGFDWSETIEGQYFWNRVIMDKNFDLFFSRYPKKKEPIVGVFKVNDTVYSWRYGNIPGTVIEADYSNYKNPLIVEFSDGYGFKRRLNYRIDGGIDDCKPELSFVPYGLVNGGFSQERPLPNLKKGDLIWVKAENGEWLYRKFRYFLSGGEIVTNNQSDERMCSIASKWSIECPIK